MDKTDPLADFFAADAAPANDRAFRTRVMERVARRRLRIELVLRLVAGCLLVLGLALVSPVLQSLADMLGQEMSMPLQVIAMAGGIAFLGHAWLSRTINLPRLRPF
ncbi:hypothetical protein AWH62_03610 [Maricaulis sp. W15]|uniref:hypothetical protein n=1 Tax=Maricaulis sp. W15 TaxID=1772333 RepID=UPI000948C9D1|nr:hypothetical protein [Maricaulis sp. W15]OLF77770.1 hypothetical protein AWH62_03610 [Maricaulis sp. W15]